MKFLLIILVFGHFTVAMAQLSPFEQSNGMASATYAEAIGWYKALDLETSKLTVKEMGTTDAGYPLHLVLISQDGKTDPAQWHHQQKTVILINNGIHAGEPDGIDASMMLARDLINGKVSLPPNVAVAIIPVYNIGGSLNRNSHSRVNQNGPVEYGFRGNSQNLDLNRDFTKSDSRESRSFAQIFHLLNPDIFIDNHVSDGADYQHTMTLITTQYEKLGGTLGQWLKKTFEPALYKSMTDKGWDMVPYVDFEATDLNKGMQMFYDPPRYSSGYAALFNTLAFVPETHMLKPFAERVKSTLDLMISFIQQSSLYAADIIRERKAANEFIQQQKQFALSWKPDSTAFSTITFKGYEPDSARSEATGLMKMFYNHDKKFTRQVPFKDHFTGSNLVTKPKAYIIPSGWYHVVELLKLNQVRMTKLEKDTVMKLGFYRIDDYKSYASPSEKHHKNYAVKTTMTIENIPCRKGDYIVYLDQPANRYIIEMLEPTGDDSFFAWNFFDAILQQKEGYSAYRWEDLAAEVLRKNPALQASLEEKKALDPVFAKDSNRILDFIYKNSPYYEKEHRRYPIYRLEN